MTTTLRRKLSSLQHNNDRWFDGHQPFNGLGYDVDDKGLLHSVYIIEQGAVLKESDDLLQTSEYPNPLRVEYQKTTFTDPVYEDEDDYEGFQCYEGKPITGFTYAFNDGCLTNEHLLENGLDNGRSLSRSWNEQGVLIEDYTNDYSYKWFDCGSLKKKIIRPDRKRIFSIGFSNPNQLDWLSFDKGYPFSEGDLETVGLSFRLNLVRDGITDEIFDCLKKKPEFEHLNLLTISRTSISIENIAELTLSKISQFRFFPPSDKPVAPYLNALRILKGKYPQCDIWFDDKEIKIDVI